MAKKIETETKTLGRIKVRNWLAVHAQFRKGGKHTDRKKAANRSACRGRVGEGEGSRVSVCRISSGPSCMYPIIGYIELAMTMFECFGEPIVTITRADLLREGQLVDVSATAKEAGFRFPVALTREAWLDCVEWSEADSDRQVLQDQSGRLWDVVWMAGLSARRNRGNTSRVEFEIWRVPRDGRATQPKATTLVLEVGPGDAGEGVLTIMLPGQD